MSINTSGLFLRERRLVMAGLRSATGWSFIALFLRLGAGVILLPLILRYVPSDHLGLWYLFISLGAAASMFELGLSKAVVRAAAALSAGASEISAAGIEIAASDHTPNVAGLARLASAVRRVYLVMAAVVAAYLVLAGEIAIPWPASADTGRLSPSIAWYFYATGEILLCYTRWQPAMLAGMGHVRLAQQYQVAGSLVYLTLGSVLLFGGLGLFGLALAQLVHLITMRLLFARSIRALVPMVPDTHAETLQTLRALWATTWRHGAMILSGTLVTSGNMLLISHYTGLHTASSYGLTLQLLSIVELVAGTLLIVKLPAMTMLRTRDDLPGLRTLVLPRLSAALLLFVLGAALIVFVGPWFLRLIGSQTVLLSLPLLLLMTAMRLLDFNQNQCVRIIISGNRVPALVPFIMTMGMVFLASWAAVQRAGVAGVVCANLLLPMLYVNWSIARTAATELRFGLGELYGLAFASLLPGHKPPVGTD